MLTYFITNVINDYDKVREEIEPHAWCCAYREDTSIYGDGINFDVLEKHRADVENYLKQNHFKYIVSKK